LNWIGGVLGISGDAKSVTGSTPFFSELNSEVAKKIGSKLKLATKK